MKNLLLLIRWIVGLLFIFSGLIKANDPLGLSYKMQEFFEAWSLHGFHDYTLGLAIVMNIFEVLAGVAVIIGWRMKLFSWLLLILIIFFTFLTGYALFSGKIKTCGCFGDCLPLSPAQSFGKDIVLLVMILVLFIYRNRVQSFMHPGLAFILLLLVTGVTGYGQLYVLKHLPVVDCLPYKRGNDILEQMKMPEGAVPDSFAIIFTYQKSGRQVEFDQSHFPVDFDSTYIYLDRKDKLVKKGNGLQPAIVDFSLHFPDGTDSTPEIFSQPHPYLLVLAKDMQHVERWRAGYDKMLAMAGNKKVPVFLVTADAAGARKLFPNASVLTCDVTVLKTAARATPTYFMMQQATILEKVSYSDLNPLLERINRLP